MYNRTRKKIHNSVVFYSEQPDYRKEPIEELIFFLKNPGRFSILVLGARGTGKTHWINKIAEQYKSEDCLSKVVSINGLIAKDKMEEYWEEKLKEADNGLLVINEVEDLSKQAQSILFEMLSTSDGKYGFKEKKYQCRLVFTSTYDIKTLRDTEEHLLHYFFDRISQLVTIFPSFMDKDGNIWKDFLATWNKMNFPKNDIPKDLKTWIEINSMKFHGNFRDLDKLAINWRNYQLKGVKETDIQSKVTEDFHAIYHFPEHKSELSDAFYIDNSLNWDDNLKKFRRQYKQWIISQYGTLRKGEKKAGISYRTMERW